MVSADEIIVPREEAESPDTAAAFAAHAASAPNMSLAAKSKPAPMPDHILNQLAESQPDLVAKYRERMTSADKDLKGAHDMQGYMGMANLVGKAATDFGNSQKEDVILKNRMQDLGKAPGVAKAERKEYDGSMLDRLGAMGVQRAKDARNNVDADYASQQKLNQEDPNSAESAQARDYLKQLAPGVADKLSGYDKLSAAQIQKVAPGLFDKYKMDVSERNADKRLQAQISADDRRADRASSKEERDMTFKLTKEYQNDVVTKRTTEIRQTRNQAEALAREPSPTNDIALVFSFMRSNDPRSTVREGEYAMAAQAGGLPQKFQAMYEQAKEGQLPVEARRNMLKTIQTNADAQEQMQVGRDAHFAEQANFYRVKPELITGKKNTTEAPVGSGSSGTKVKSAKDLP